MSSEAPVEAPREVTPPPLQAPTAKEKKYDRQLRLWAAAGQRALEESHVLMLVGGESGSNSSVAGAETLKNLILPGIGHFTVADSAVVTEADLGINFFLETSSLGKQRAEEATKFLQELNPDVEGHSISQPLKEWLPQPDSLKPYNLILIFGPIDRDELTTLATYALEAEIPLADIRCMGFYGTFSIQLPTLFPIVDTHPDQDSTQDLRLLAPWPELTAAQEALGDLSPLSDHDHGHVPWLLLLLRHLQEWKSSHADTYPSTFKDKTTFRDYVRSKARTNNPEGGEENYDEACAAVLKSINPPAVRSGCLEMFKMDACTNLTPSSANFWIVANAIKQFYHTHSVLPLPGSIPDMKATSQDYIKLQTLYKTKARHDVEEVTRLVRDLEKQLNRSGLILASEIEQFCKNASFVKVLTNSNRLPVPELRLKDQDPKTLEKLPSILTSYESISEIWLAINAQHIPTSTLDSYKKLQDEMYVPPESNDDEEEEGEEAEEDPRAGPTLQNRIDNTIAEVQRCQNGELHNTSSVLGGMVAQEAIKLLTRQYVPVDGTVIWDGMRARTEVIRL